jgi:hypothetical protein
MTSDEFRAEYRLLKCIAERGVQSYTAQATASGGAVMVHFLDDEAPEESRALLAQLGRLGASDRAKLLETVDVAGATVVVTQVLANFTSLPQWLDGRLGDRARVPADAPESRKGSDTPPAAVHPDRDASPDVAPPPPDSARESPPGFTELFKPPLSPADVLAAGDASPAAPEFAPPRPAAPGPADLPQPGARPGEFTQLFLGPAAAAPGPTDGASELPRQSPSLTHLLSGLAQSDGAAAPRKAPEPPAPPRQGTERGERSWPPAPSLLASVPPMVPPVPNSGVPPNGGPPAGAAAPSIASGNASGNAPRNAPGDASGGLPAAESPLTSWPFPPLVPLPEDGSTSAVFMRPPVLSAPPDAPPSARAQGPASDTIIPPPAMPSSAAKPASITPQPFAARAPGAGGLPPGASEYSRIIGGAARTFRDAPPIVQPPPVHGADARAPSYLPLAVALGVVVVATVALIVYFLVAR